MSEKNNNNTNNRKRLSVSFSEEQYDAMEHWAKKEGVSKNAFIIEAIDHYIAFKNHDFDVPSAMVERMNQLIDVVALLSANQRNLEDVVLRGFDTILGISRGTTYLNDEDGSL